MKTSGFFVLLLAATLTLKAQEPQLIAAGSKAPSFVLNRGDNAIQGFTMPYMNKIVLLHFWNSNQVKSTRNNKYLNWLLNQYSDADYINAEGFEIISVAVQSDQNSWKQSLVHDSIDNFINGIAIKGYREDDACLKFGVSKTPTDLLIDESGTVVMVNPRLMDIENFLDSKRNMHPLKKDIEGYFAQASDKNDKTKYTRVYLFNHYGDSIAFTRTSDSGYFSFHEIRLRQDFLLRMENQLDIVTSDPIALYSADGELLVEGKTVSGGFDFFVPARICSKLIIADSSNHATSPLEVIITKSIEFKSGSESLTAKDEAELAGLLSILQKNKKSVLEISAHTDTQLDEAAAKRLTDKQCLSLKSYFMKKGVSANRLRSLSMGNSQPRISCAPNCTEAENKQNRRVEFTILKN